MSFEIKSIRQNILNIDQESLSFNKSEHKAILPWPLGQSWVLPEGWIVGVIDQALPNRQRSFFFP
jgi:hypothetical protein